MKIFFSSLQFVYISRKEKYTRVTRNYILFLIQTSLSHLFDWYYIAPHLTNVDNRSDYTYRRSARVRNWALKGEKVKFHPHVCPDTCPNVGETTSVGAWLRVAIKGESDTESEWCARTSRDISDSHCFTARALWATDNRMSTRSTLLYRGDVSGRKFIRMWYLIDVIFKRGICWFDK